MASLSAEIRVTDMVQVDALKPNPWNTNIVPPENEAKIDASLKRLGFFKPITVRQLDDGSFQILGGQHRWESARRLGHKHVPIFNVGKVSDAKAKEIGLADNARYGEDDTFALAGLLKELGVEDLQSFLPYDEADFASIFAAESISLESLDLDDKTPSPELAAASAAATHQIMRLKVPVEDVAWITAVLEKRMRDRNYTTEDSQTNAGNAFVDLMKEHK